MSRRRIESSISNETSADWTARPSPEKISRQLRMPAVSISVTDGNGIPPLPPDHGFQEGDRVEIPIYGLGRGIKAPGTVRYIDTRVGKQLYRGYVVIADHDKRCYILDPRLAQKIQAKKENPPTAT